ncbi:MAG: hypothetical protein E7040_03795 [Lentisphaerae bacterium]|nr:hypothetical protein [Lentisphaerota bacterium]
MPDILKTCIAFLPYMLTAFLSSLLLTRSAVILLPKLSFIDKPHGRHQHKRIIPRGGGIAIWLAFFLSTGLMAAVLHERDIAYCAELHRFFRTFFLPALLILVLGIIDDKFELSSILKLLGQILAGLWLFSQDCGITHILSYQLPTYISLPLSIIWCILIINAFNLIDGLDGIAAGLASISSFLLAVWILVSGESLIMASFLMIFCGACMGFLRYNFAPARIFMGDTGSMFIGLFFAYFSMEYSAKAVTFTSLLVPLMAMGVPMFDVFLAVWRRILRRYVKKDPNSSIMQGDHDHLHHRIQKETGHQHKTAYIIYGISALLSVVTMVSVFFDSKLPALIFIVFLIIIFTFIKYAHIELYDTMESMLNGIKTPHRNFLFTALHPVIDSVLVLSSFLFCQYLFAALKPPHMFHGWFLIFIAPFTITLCLSGIYRTFWMRVGIRRYFQLMIFLALAGCIGFVLNYTIMIVLLKNPETSLRNFCGFYLVFFLFSVMLIILERFLLHYLESFGFRHLYERNLGKNPNTQKVLIYGGGLYCRLYLSYLYSGFTTRHNEKFIVGICDDNEALQDLNIYGFYVLGNSDKLEKIYKKKKFNEILITVSDLSDEKRKALTDFASANKIKLTQFICKEDSFEGTSLKTEEN